MNKDIVTRALKTFFQSLIAAGLIVYSGDDIGTAETPMVAILAMVISLGMNYVQKEMERAKAAKESLSRKEEKLDETTARLKDKDDL